MKELLDMFREDPKGFIKDLIGVISLFVIVLGFYIFLYIIG